MRRLIELSGIIVLTNLALAQAPAFDVVSIKPNNTVPIIMELPPPAGGNLRFTRATLKAMVGVAYKAKPSEISGGPSWVATDRYDVSAKTGELSLSDERYRFMLQAMLQDRFQLAAHRESKEMTVYALVVAGNAAGKNGLRLGAAKEGACAPPAVPPPPPSAQRLPICGGFNITASRLLGYGVTTGRLADALTNIVGRPVIDKTRYTGTFDVQLDFTRESTVFNAPATGPEAANGAATAPSIFTALQEQLGLKLESQKGTVEVLVIDHAEKPSEN
jgi:uncharacterized protein (TIGR03435 family)